MSKDPCTLSFVIASAGSSTQIFSVVSPCLRYQIVASDHAITDLFLSLPPFLCVSKVWLSERVPTSLCRSSPQPSASSFPAQPVIAA